MTYIRRQIIEVPILAEICKTIAETRNGLKGHEIKYFINDSGLTDTTPLNTKWKRLLNSFVDSQNKKECSNNILLFIEKSMKPDQYIGKEELFQNRRHEINKHLSLIGLELTEDAKLKKIENTETKA